jgi:hypothetical protein
LGSARIPNGDVIGPETGQVSVPGPPLVASDGISRPAICAARRSASRRFFFALALPNQLLERGFLGRVISSSSVT